MAILQNFPADNEAPIVRGEALLIDFTITTTTVDITGWTVCFTLRAKDGRQLINQVMTVTSGTGKTMRLALTHAQLNLPAGIYSYDIWREDAGSETCLRLGT